MAQYALRINRKKRHNFKAFELSETFRQRSTSISTSSAYAG